MFKKPKYVFMNKAKLKNITNPWAYPVIVVIELISRFSLNTLPNINHMARLENTQANAPSSIPKNIISKKLLKPLLNIAGK